MKTTTLQRITMPGRTWWLDEQYRLGTSTAFAWGLKRGKTLFKSRPNMQRIEIFDNEEFGRVLALDGMMQLSTKYEYIYHEMLTHPAVLAHPKPLHALIIGGGDGGVLRELIKYPFERIVMVEIDRAVIELCEKFLPSVSNRAFRDPRLEIIIADAAAYIKTGRHEFDIVVSDITDRYGPSARLWSKRSYAQIRDQLAPGGVAIFQTGLVNEKYARTGRRGIAQVFPYWQVHRAFVPCFPFYESSFTVGSVDRDVRQVDVELIEQRIGQYALRTRYYCGAIHQASASRGRAAPYP